MDLFMPRMDGLEATRRIMQEAPVPIVIVSAAGGDQASATFSALEAGALAFVPRPAGPGDAHHDRQTGELVRMVKLMAEVKVVRRRVAGSRPRGEGESPAGEGPLRVVAIGASTGGPVALQALLDALPADFGAPVLIVQHIAEGFLDGFLQWLNRSSRIPLKLPADGEAALAGHAYVAPDWHHMSIDARMRISLSAGPPEGGLRPSVAHLMRSVCAAFGPSAAAVLLSGMGRDGATELLELKRRGAHTFVQDQASSVVHGMPGAELRLDAARYVMTPAEIGRQLVQLAGRDRGLRAAGDGSP
jgi:two-component system chemotaxis response regulator CheB